MAKVTPERPSVQAESGGTNPTNNQPATTMDLEEPQNASVGVHFVIGFTISQILGVICIVLVWIWTGNYMKGFAQSSLGLNFNYHPLFMVMGMVFLYGDAILVYRILKNTSKLRLKLIHGGLHTAAFCLAIVALKAVFDSHNYANPPIPNLYSLHSWIGIVTVVLFSMQFVFGFVSFLFPGLSRSLRSAYLPLHIFFGILIFAMAIISCLTGMTEKLIWTIGLSGTWAKREPPSTLVNFLGLCIVAFGALVGYLVAMPQFKRKPLPEEAHLNMMDSGSLN